MRPRPGKLVPRSKQQTSADGKAARGIAARIDSIIDDVIRRRGAGDDVSDEEILKQNHKLRPELDECLRLLEGIASARQQAEKLQPESDDHRDVLALERRYLNDALPDYKLLNLISQGGQGAVYRAIQRSTHRTVALKILPGGPLAPEARHQRFAREVELLGKLVHPNIVRLYDCGMALQQPYFAMELIEGHPIDLHADAGRLDANARILLLLTVCDAVTAAHQRGILHRDLKPANILVDSEGRPHLLDFGLGKYFECEGDHEVLTLSMDGQVAGTVSYLSPEQISRPSDQLDIRTDVYSLGVLLFKLLTGRFPYDVTSGAEEARFNILRQEAMPLRRALAEAAQDCGSRVGHIGRDLEAVVGKTLEKERERRYQSVADFADDLRRYVAGDAVNARSNSGLYALGKSLRRHRWPMLIATVILLIAGTLGGGWVRSITKQKATSATGDLRLALERDHNRFMLDQLQMASFKANRLDEIRDLEPEYATKHLSRYEQTPIVVDDVEALFLADVPWEIVSMASDPNGPDFDKAELWLQGASDKLDVISRRLPERSLHFPLAKANTFRFGRNDVQKAAVMWTGHAFLGRAYSHFYAGRHCAAVEDLTSARQLACDLADCLPLTQKHYATTIRSQAAAFVQRALTKFLPEAHVGNKYVEWLLSDPELASYSSGIAFEETAFLEFVASVFVTDAHGSHRHLDLNKLDQTFDGSLREMGAMTPRHLDYAQGLQPDDVEAIVESLYGQLEAWDSMNYAQLAPLIQEFNSWLENERGHNALLYFAVPYGGSYEAKLCIQSSRRALRLIAHLARYRQYYGGWPDDHPNAVPSTCIECLTDPITGVPFEVDYQAGIPRIRSASGYANLFTENFLAQHRDLFWMSPGDTRLTYFPAPSSR